VHTQSFVFFHIAKTVGVDVLETPRRYTEKEMSRFEEKKKKQTTTLTSGTIHPLL
jgi:hypothetical protein